MVDFLSEHKSYSSIRTILIAIAYSEYKEALDCVFPDFSDNIKNKTIRF